MNEKNRERILNNLFTTIIVSLIALILWFAMIERTIPPSSTGEVQTLSGLHYILDSGESNEITLPYRFEQLSPRTPVTLSTQITAQSNQCLLVKTVYSPLRLYADDVLIYECGQDGSYSTFLLDPPTIVNIVSLPKKSTSQQLRFEYLSPTQRDSLLIPTILIGRDEALLIQLSKENGFTFISSLLQMAVGLVLIAAALIFVHIEPRLKLFMWLGLFSLATGAWSLGECDLTGVLFPYPELLYIMAFVGLFTFPIPLLRCGILLLNLHHRWLPNALMLMQNTAVAGALALQLLGICALSRSMYLFHMLIPLSLILFTVQILWESIRYPNLSTRYLMLPMLALAISVFIERINYQFRFTDVLSLFTQIGVLFFILSLGWIGGNYACKAIQATAEKTKLEVEVNLMELQLDVQRLQYETIMKNAGEIKKQHHDLRHQITAIKQYNDRGDTVGLNNYLGELISAIPVYKELTLCENLAVNAVALYYLSAAEQKGIHVQLKLHIPAHCGCVLDSDLCVIVGNLFENAVEACEKMTGDNRTIKLSSFVQYDLLVIVVDNSFNGVLRQKNGMFISSKNGDFGTGISSVEAVAKKYGGMAKFEAHENLFSSSIYIQMRNQKSKETSIEQKTTISA